MAAAIARVRGGHPDAYRELVERYQRPLFRTLRRYVDSDADAMDLVQQALIRAYQRLDTLERAEAFRGWLFRIGINLALNHRRDRARHEAEPLDAVIEPAADSTVEQDLVAHQRMAQVRAALDGLTPTQRDVLLLRLEGELEYPEIAAQVGSTPGAARVHFHNAVKRLRALLAGTDTETGAAPVTGDGAALRIQDEAPR